MDGEREEMPSVVLDSDDTFTVCAVVLMFGGLTMLGIAGCRRVLEIQIGMAMGYGLLAVAFSQPFNPFRGYGEPLRGRSTTWAMTGELSERERRILALFYDPRNRRRASRFILATWLGVEALWLVSLWIPRGLPSRICEKVPAPQLGAVVCFFGLILSGWMGFLGLTREMGGKWEHLLAEGPVWPIEIEYPGPRKEVIRSFLTGESPAFLGAAKDGGTSTAR